MAYFNIVFTLICSYSLQHVLVNGQPPGSEEMKRKMMSDWMNFRKFKPLVHSQKEKEYFNTCNKVKFRPRYGDDDDEYYQFDYLSIFQPKAGTVTRNVRCKKKELRMLTRDELVAWSSAFRAWNTAVVDTSTGRTEQEVFIMNHRYDKAQPAHYGPCFLSWHQTFLELYEAALQKHNSSVCPPFWDSRLDQCLTNPHESVLWSKDLMGTRHGPVVEGLFANLTIHPADCRRKPTEPYIYRDVVNGTDGRYYLYSDPVQDGIFSRASNNYTQLCYPKYAEFEDTHGYGHMWVGGSMGPLACSPNEPMFWLHHQNVNRLFKTFIRDRPMSQNRSLYYPDWEDVPKAQRSDAPMTPFDETNANITCGSGLEEKYDLWEMYVEPPGECEKHSDCGSDMLWCKPNCNGRQRCSAKIMEGGKCQDYPIEACYKPLDCLAKKMACKDLGNGKVCTCDLEVPVETSNAVKSRFRPKVLDSEA